MKCPAFWLEVDDDIYETKKKTKKRKKDDEKLFKWVDWARAARDFFKDFGVFEHAKPKKSLARRGVWNLIRGWGHLLAPGGAPGGPDLT